MLFFSAFSRYKENTKKLAALAMDQPMTGLEKVVWWIEYVIRNRGAKHLRNPAADLPFYQYFLLDTAAALLAFFGVLTICLWILWKIVKKICILMLQFAIQKCTNSQKMKTS